MKPAFTDRTRESQPRSRAEKRRRSLWRKLARLINRSGVYVTQYLPDWLERRPDIDFQGQRRRWIADNAKNNDGDLVRLLFLIRTVEALEADAVPGAFAELGVWRGNSAELLHAIAPARVFYLFDTFAGFAAGDVARDPAAFRPELFDDTSLERVRQRLGPSPQLRFCAGQFPATTAGLPAGERFALVHIDCDLGAPARAALEFFYPRMSPKGVILVHDYDSGLWPGVTDAVDGFFADKPEGVVRIPDKSGTAAIICQGRA